MSNFTHYRLRDRIKALGLTQKAVAKAIGTSESLFSKKLSGIYMFTQPEIEAISGLLGIKECEIGRYFFSETKSFKSYIIERLPSILAIVISVIALVRSF